VKTLALCIFLATTSLAQNDAGTYLKVEKARAEVPSCRKLVETSQATGTISLMFMSYSELDKHANQLTHCGFVFRMTGDAGRADEAGNESDRYDAVAAQQMQRYLKAKKLWEDFLKQDCSEGSSQCGTR
jgi:hypothetical protein